MKLFWAGCIFGAGYVLGRPQGRAKLAELLQRPEVTELRQQAASTASTAVKTGRQQLTEAAQKIKDTTAEKRAGKTTDGSGVASEAAGSRRGLRLPSFSRTGVGPDASTVPAAGPGETATGTATHTPRPVSADESPAAPSATRPDAPEELR
jgi:hypothetical protein